MNRGIGGNPRRAGLLLAALLPLLCAADAPTTAPSAGASVITLHDEAYVKGPRVLLGDLARIEGENAEELAAIEIAPAAAPGGSKRINATLLKSRIRSVTREGSAVEVRGADAVTATTLSLQLSPEMLAADLRRYIESEMPWDPANTTIDIATPAQECIVPDGAMTVDWRPSPTYAWVGKGVFRGEVLVDGMLQSVVLANAVLETYADVVVAATEIPRGAIVSRSNLRTEKKAMSTLRQGFFEDPDEVAGMVTRSTLFPGTQILTRHVAPRRIVRRNQAVTVEVRQGGLVVRDRALAMGDAGEGDLLTCRNPQSKEEFVGVVQADGTVVIE